MYNLNLWIISSIFSGTSFVKSLIMHIFSKVTYKNAPDNILPGVY